VDNFFKVFVSQSMAKGYEKEKIGKKHVDRM
jgi:hypothetical protein